MRRRLLVARELMWPDSRRAVASGKVPQAWIQKNTRHANAGRVFAKGNYQSGKLALAPAGECGPTGEQGCGGPGAGLGDSCGRIIGVGEVDRAAHDGVAG